MTDKEKLLELLKDFNVDYKIFSDDIEENALNAGAVETICMRNEVDFAFDKFGRYCGSYTTSARSWKPGHKNINGYCPHCGADLDGDLIVETFIVQGSSREEALKSASHYSGWKEHGEANRWGRAIGLSSIEHDRVMAYRCPDCGEEWKR